MNHSASSKDLLKAEQEVGVSIRKALNGDETAPKQKHVRVAILFTFEFKDARPIWYNIKLQNVLADEIQCYKALILIHKVLHNGHASMLHQTKREVDFMDAMKKAMRFEAVRGYKSLIFGYIDYLKTKLKFHNTYPDFPPDLDYDKYLVSGEIEDKDEKFLSLMGLMDLLDGLDAFQRSVFASIEPYSRNECRIASLVPLVEESYGIYKFCTNMLTSLHFQIPKESAKEALAPMRENYLRQYSMLRKFYDECRTLRYLTTLVRIPELPDTPKDFVNMDRGEENHEAVPPREKTPPAEDPWSSVTNITPENYTQPPQGEQLINISQESSQSLSMFQPVQQGSSAFDEELRQLRFQREKDLAMINEMNDRIMQYESMSQFNDPNMIVRLQEEIAQWKAKYENIAKMYAQLRKEHLELLKKLKEYQKQVSSLTQSSNQSEVLQKTLDSKAAEIIKVSNERDNFKAEIEKLKEQNVEQTALLRREAAEAKAKLSNVDATKVAEFDKIRQALEAEKAELKRKLSDFDKMRSKFEEMKDQLTTFKTELDSKDGEILVLQKGLDQSLLALKQVQDRGSSTEADLTSKLDNMSLEHRKHMDKIMDSVLEDCKGKASDAIFELDSAAHPGNNSAVPELVLSILEKMVSSSNELAASFNKYLIGGETGGDNEADAIRCATNLAQIIDSGLLSSKGIVKHADADAAENLIKFSREIGKSGVKYFHRLQSNQLASIEYADRPAKLQQFNNEFQGTIYPLSKLVETLVPKDVGDTKFGEDLGDIVEQEMMGAAKAIEEATAMLSKLLNSQPDPSLSGIDQQVHSGIISSTKAITDAIGRLIICATHAQQEIVANGKGSGTKTAFYKKNSRWMEGLISAAKAVATATKTLVECANGVVHGTHKMEQLVVAAHEVAGATAQLVSASRVKAIRGSSTQDKLEGAARAVTDATRLLVKTADKIRSEKVTQQAHVDYSTLSTHEFKKKEMEQKVEIATLEKKLDDSRQRLAEMRRNAYHKESDYSLSL